MGGKARSALNSLTHGGYARGDIAISRGVFKEDPDELEAMLNAVAQSLDPRDEIEWQQARHIAGLFNRRNRVDRFENHAVAHDSMHEHLGKLEGLAETHEQIAATAGLMSDALSDRHAQADAYPWEAFARFTLNLKNDGNQLWVKDLWSEDRVPASSEEWRSVTKTLLKHLLGNLEAGEDWVLDLYSEHMDQASMRRAEAAEAAASRILNGLLEKTVRLSGTLGRQITQAVHLYGQLRARDLAEVCHHDAVDDDGHEEVED